MKHHKSLSLALFNALEDLGATIEITNIKMEVAISGEILGTIVVAPSSVYVFGSAYEGTSTEGLLPDSDVALILSDMPVITDIVNCPSSNSYLLVPEEQPGYVRLQLVHNGDVQWETCQHLELDMCHHLSLDMSNRVCLVQNSEGLIRTGMYRKEGPAIHFDALKNVPSSDTVVALSCTDWPDCAQEWLSRKRIHGWPSKELIKQCSSLGFILVSACHPASDEKQFQWRISFSHQERLLVTQFNSVQLKCYILLKIIKKELIQQYIKEDTLTSYHLKTCMLYILENTPSELWVPENLVGCLIMCLQQIHLWIRDEKIPNYFIPEENMLDRITQPELRRKLAGRIDWILNCEIHHVLCKLRIGEIEHHLMRLPERQIYPLLSQIWRIFVSLKKLLMGMGGKLNTIRFMRVYQPYIGCLLYDRDSRIKHMKEALVHKISDLVGTRRITIHTEEETRRALLLILPFLYLSVLSCEIVQRIDKPTEAVKYILMDSSWFLVDHIYSSAKLKQASALSMLGYQQLSIDVLSSFTVRDKLYLCSCYDPVVHDLDVQLLLQAIQDRHDITAIELLRDYTQPCVHFFPHEQQITPVAINYEMIRSYVTPFKLLEKHYLIPQWYGWGVVDGHFLRWFLLYLNRRDLGHNSQATKNVKKMIRLLNFKTVCHRETCLNLLGYVHRDRGEINRAVQCFDKSLQTNPLCNAAFWHLCFLICETMIKR